MCSLLSVVRAACSALAGGAGAVWGLEAGKGLFIFPVDTRLIEVWVDVVTPTPNPFRGAGCGWYFYSLWRVYRR